MGVSPFCDGVWTLQFLADLSPFWPVPKLFQCG
jgi:hypothetical protein